MDAEHASDDGGQPSTAAESDPPESEATSRVSIELASGALPRADEVDSTWIVGRLEAVLDILSREGAPPVGRVAIRIVDDSEMDALHRRHSGIEGTTDVLTFVESLNGDLEVDVVTCLDEAARRVTEIGHDLRRELLLYVVHGVLHAIGHDDHESEAHARMHAEEDRLLELVGVGPVYDRGGDA